MASRQPGRGRATSLSPPRHDNRVGREDGPGRHGAAAAAGIPAGSLPAGDKPCGGGSVGKPVPEGTAGAETRSAGGRRAAHLVELLVELAELGHLLHHLLPHEEGGVNGSVALGAEALQGVLDQRLLQEHQGTLGTREATACRTPAPLRRPFSLSGSGIASSPRRLQAAPAARLGVTLRLRQRCRGGSRGGPGHGGGITEAGLHPTP